MADEAKRRGRPPLRKKGAFTPTERQQRRRLRLRREKAKAERHAKMLLNQRKYRLWADDPERLAKEAADLAVWNAEHFARTARAAPHLPRADGPADELVRQIDEFMAEDGEMTIDDVRAAIDRRFGPH